MSRFSAVPNISISRSKFTNKYHHKTSFNMGELIPFEVTEVLPGDTFKCNMSQVTRISSALLKPIMDNLFLDVYYFFVPNRLTLDTWERVMGENKDNAWAPAVEYKVPMMTVTNVATGSIADYMGLPVGNFSQGSAGFKCNPLPFRAYALIWNEFFRDQNVQDPVSINLGSGSIPAPNNNVWSATNYMGKPAPVCKLHDYFTSALPAPQKGNGVNISVYGDVPVINNPNTVTSSITPLSLYNIDNSSISQGFYPLYLEGVGESEGVLDRSSTAQGANTVGNIEKVGVSLVAKTSELAVTNVNDLRYAFQLQKMLEKDARGGTRYREILQSHFGVTAPDSRMQIPEFLGGCRTPLNITQVEQTTGSSDKTLGQLGAYSLSNGFAGYTKGFVEHGFVIGVLCVRQHHTYQQGLEKFWTRSKRTDYYDPVFANIGEQPVMQSELFASTSESNTFETVFGYQEAWADYRYKPSRISGELRSTASESLDIWHLGDKYTNAPILGNQFVSETPVYLDRALAVPSTTSDQFIMDIYSETTMIRPMPVYSVPGLIDHH